MWGFSDPVFTDVGGGSVENGATAALSRIPLRWMIRQCFECNTGIIFDAVMLQQLGLGIYTDERTREPALAPPPERLPAEYRARSHLKTANIFSTILPFMWSLLTFPFLRILGVFRLLRRHPARHIQLLEHHMIPARFDHRFYQLKPYNRASAMEHEAKEEKEDALSPLYDQLKAAWGWHILEWIPQKVKKQKAIRGSQEYGFKWV